ncbi:MAG: tetratricopeptide repeat protein [Planctomycetota bacterium]
MNDWTFAEENAARAWRHYEAGRWEHALRDLRKALAVNPDQPEWLFGLGLTLDALGRFHEAALSYQAVLDQRPDDVEALLHLGINQVRLMQSVDAIQNFEKVQELDPDNHASYCHRIAAYTQLGEYDQAEVMFYLAQQSDPDCPVCYDHLAHAMATQAQLPRAAWCWQRVLELDRHHPLAHANLGRAHWYLGEYTQARYHLEHHVLCDPTDVETTLELAALLLEMDQTEPAAGYLSTAVSLAPHNARAHHLLGDTALKLGKPEEAEQAFEAARRIEPNRPGVRLGLALAARERGEQDASIDHLIAELSVGGQDGRQVLQTARLLVEAEQYDHAIALLTPMAEGLDDMFVDDAPGLSRLLQIRGVALAAVGSHAQAITDCRRACKLDRSNTAALQQLVVEYLHVGDTDRARVCLQRAIQLSPEDPHLRHLATQLKWQRLGSIASRFMGRAA